jgi:acetoin utilization protein AcuB
MRDMTDVANAELLVILVRDVMTRGAITIAPDTSHEHARRLMDEHDIRHLPVVTGGRLVGMVSDRDLRSAEAHEPPLVANRFMTREPVTVTSGARIEHAARLMLAHRFGSLPVVDAGMLAGIVTYTDLLRAFVRVIETATAERIAVDFRAAA